MRHYFLLLFLIAGMMQARATDYKYLVLQQSDGTQIDLTSDGLKITFSDGNLVASDGTTVALTSLSKMFFSEEPTGITELLVDADAPTVVYTIAGAYVGRYDNAQQARQSLRPGVYLLKNNGRTLKVAVK